MPSHFPPGFQSHMAANRIYTDVYPFDSSSSFRTYSNEERRLIIWISEYSGWLTEEMVDRHLPGKLEHGLAEEKDCKEYKQTSPQSRHSLQAEEVPSLVTTIINYYIFYTNNINIECLCYLLLNIYYILFMYCMYFHLLQGKHLSTSFSTSVTIRNHSMHLLSSLVFAMNKTGFGKRWLVWIIRTTASHCVELHWGSLVWNLATAQWWWQWKIVTVCVCVRVRVCASMLLSYFSSTVWETSFTNPHHSVFTYHKFEVNLSSHIRNSLLSFLGQISRLCGFPGSRTLPVVNQIRLWEPRPYEQCFLLTMKSYLAQKSDWQSKLNARSWWAVTTDPSLNSLLTISGVGRPKRPQLDTGMFLVSPWQ